MTFDPLMLSPAFATILFCVTCLAGYQYRRVWKAEGPTYQYWLFGMVAALDAGIAEIGRIVLVAMCRHRATVFEIDNKTALGLTSAADSVFLRFHGAGNPWQ